MLNVRIKTLTRSLEEVRQVNLKYQNAKGIVSERTIEPSRVYESKEGKLVVFAYDHLREEYREFRLDRMMSCRIGDEYNNDPEGKVKVHPTEYRLCKVPPQVVSYESAEQKYIPAGWSRKPVAQILRH